MNTTVRQLQNDSLGSRYHYWRGIIRPSIERLRSVQLRQGSFYSTLRCCIPIPVLALVWFWVIHRTIAAHYELLFGISITVRHLLLGIGIVALWNLWFGLSMYTRESAKQDLFAEASRLSVASIACGTLPLLANLTRGSYGPGFMLAGLTTFGLLAMSLALLGIFLCGAVLSPRLLRPPVALIVGSGKRATALRARLQSHYFRPQIFGCVDNEYQGQDPQGDKYLGPLSNLAELLKTHPIEVVLIGLPMKSMYDEIQQVIEICEVVGVDSHYMQDIFATTRANVEPHPQEPRHFTVLSTLKRDPKQHLKRALDFVLALLLIAITSPLMIAAAIAVRLSGPGPILFVQQRYGRNRKRFPMFKFRSMVVDAEQRQASLETRNEAQGPVFKLKSDPRVTRVGSFLRRTSIDELPQLFNVLRGEMSLVGPRPLPLRDVSRFEESWLLRRFSVRPGLTCLWQVNGRSEMTFDRWIEQDLTYIDQWSLALDFKILLMTIPAVLKGSGAV